MSTDHLPQGKHSVCPRCGTAAGENLFCDACGLNLNKHGELPTADEYSALHRERRWLEKKEHEFALKGADTPQVGSVSDRRSRGPGPGVTRSMISRRGVVLGLFAVLLLTTGVVAVLTTTGPRQRDAGTPTRSSANEPAVDAPPRKDQAPLSRAQAARPEQRCLDLWNATDDHVGKGMTLPSIGMFEGDRVSVGFASEFPDRCLVTVAFATRAFQFLEDESIPGSWRPLHDPAIDVAHLPPSVTAWNAKLNADANLSVYGGSGEKTSSEESSVEDAGDEVGGTDECDDIIVTPNSGNVMYDVRAIGIPCSDVEQLLSAWGKAEYPQPGPDGFSCAPAIERGLEYETTCENTDGSARILYVMGP